MEVDGVETAPIPHGQKRRAQDNLDNEQRLTKRFNLLNLEHHDKLYFPTNLAAPSHQHRSIGDADSMHLDDTKHKVYINNLDEELFDIEREGEKLLFLPDIEKKLARIPKSVLTNGEKPIKDGELVLYSVPTSLSVPQEKDSVRKAIIETRARARERQAQIPQLNGSVAAVIGNGVGDGFWKGNEFVTIHTKNHTSLSHEDDVDAMDIS